MQQIEDKPEKLYIQETSHTLTTIIVATVFIIVNYLAWRSRSNGTKFLVASSSLLGQALIWYILNSFEEPKQEIPLSRTVSHITQVLAIVLSIVYILVLFYQVQLQ